MMLLISSALLYTHFANMSKFLVKLYCLSTSVQLLPLQSSVNANKTIINIEFASTLAESEVDTDGGDSPPIKEETDPVAPDRHTRAYFGSHLTSVLEHILGGLLY